MERIKSTEKRLIGNVEYTVNQVEELEYSGGWMIKGWRVIDPHGRYFTFFGYPIDGDIERIFAVGSLPKL